jgi:hypothetical protein
MDKEEVPCITIQVSQSQEADDLATLADMSHIVDEFSPDQVSKPIKFIVPPFKITSYDNTTGLVVIPDTVDTINVRPEMVMVNPETGSAYIIQSIDSSGVFLEPGLKLKNVELAIIPKYQIYRARRERAIFREVYNIGCHSHGDPSTLIFLHSAVTYILLRYREGLLESKNFQLSSIGSSDMMQNSSFQQIQENVYSRFITLRGQAEFSWIKTPTRVIEAVSIGNLEETGIKVISKKKVHTEEDAVWETIDE